MERGCARGHKEGKREGVGGREPGRSGHLFPKNRASHGGPELDESSRKRRSELMHRQLAGHCSQHRE